MLNASPTSLKKLRKSSMSRNNSKKWRDYKEDSITRKILKEEDKQRSLKMIITTKSWLASSRLLMSSTPLNCLLRSILPNHLVPRKFKKPELPESKKKKENSKEKEIKNWLWAIQISVSREPELSRKTNLFTSTTISSRMFTPDNSTAKDKLLRKRKSLRPNWQKLNLENKKLSIRKLLKLSRQPTRKITASKEKPLRKSS